jgi:hypothetical protein
MRPNIYCVNTFNHRSDVITCWPGVRDFYYSPDYGSLVKRKIGWYATNDKRIELVGNTPNKDLISPTLGPFENEMKAAEAYAKAARGMSVCAVRGKE